MSIKLRNNTSGKSKIGCTVIIDPKNPHGFIYASADENNIVGIISEEVARYEQCEILTSGTAKVRIADMTVQGAVIRAQKSSDNISLGFCKTAKSTDIPYFKIGTAAEGGKNLISVLLNFNYLSSTARIDHGTLTGLADNDHPQYALATNAISEEFETVSKNLKSYPYNLTYGVDGLDTIVYDLGGGLSVTKTFNYTLSVLTSIVLSGDTPSGIELTKTFSYTGIDLTGVTYS